MLQYSVHLPPLSLSSSKPSKPPTRRDISDDLYRNNASSTSGPLINPKRSHYHTLHDKHVPARPAYAALPHPHAIPLAVSTAFSSSSSSSPTAPSPISLASPLASPKPIPRSPLIASSRALASPAPRSPHPLRSNLPSFDGSSSQHSSISSTIVDVLSPGDLVGEDLPLQGDIIHRVPITSSPQLAQPQSLNPQSVEFNDTGPAREFQVVRRLGTGSYAVVYLVREVLYRLPPSDDGHEVAAVGRMELDEQGRTSTEYGREYAIKLLSKANLDEEALAAQLFEATIHQSLRAHPNIVTLHRTFETSAFLLLLLEFVPGEDLFYFLEQARDHYDSDPPTSSPVSPLPPSATSQPEDPSDNTSTSPMSTSDSSTYSSSRTPPTPSLLSSLNPTKLLSRTRLRLIASMFSQMCEAVAACHDQHVFHRDIKPENFIVTDGWSVDRGRMERRVVVKLTDFGLSTTDVESVDMDCGSAPYMSFECRNNIHPTYSPRAADVWSLGIVLINMLYHYNPWSDTTEGVCPSFDLYRQNPVQFFMSRFTGMTLPVAEYLANNVFCILKDPKDDSQRVEAGAFGVWVRDLPSLLGAPSASAPPSSTTTVTGSTTTALHSSGASHHHQRNISASSTFGYRLASIPHSRRPSLRSGYPPTPTSATVALSSLNNTSSAGDMVAASSRASWALSRAPSLGPAYEVTAAEEGFDDLGSGLGSVLSPVPDHEPEEEAENDVEVEVEVETESRSASTQKRRKRGARKGKGGVSSVAAAVQATNPTANLVTPTVTATAGGAGVGLGITTTKMDDTLNTLAEASQALAREISRTSRSGSQPPCAAAASAVVTSPLHHLHPHSHHPHHQLHPYPQLHTTYASTSTSTSTTSTPSGAVSSTSMYPSIATAATTTTTTVDYAIPVALSHSQTQQTPLSLQSQLSSSPLQQQQQHVSVPSLSTNLSSYSASTPISTSILTTSPPSSTATAAAAVHTSSPPALAPAPAPAPITKKPSKWKLGFGKSSHGHSDRERLSSSSSSTAAAGNNNNNSNKSPPPPSIEEVPLQSATMSSTASNVTNLLMGLNAPPPSESSSSSASASSAFMSNNKGTTYYSAHQGQSVVSLDDPSVGPAQGVNAGTWSRGRRPAVVNGVVGSGVGSGSGGSGNTWGPSAASSAFGATGSYAGHPSSSSSTSQPTTSNPSANGNGSSINITGDTHRRSERNISPSSTRSGRPLASSASSMASSTSNWRSSMSSAAGSSTSAFTRYSNGSVRSVSTAATSVSSASSWRSGGGGSKYPYSYDTPGQLPPNVKLVTGTPWELDQLPRQMYPNPQNVTFGAPPVRKPRRGTSSSSSTTSASSPPTTTTTTTTSSLSSKSKSKSKDFLPSTSSTTKLDTITEFPSNHQHQNLNQGQSQGHKSPLAQRQDASTSTTDLADRDRDRDRTGNGGSQHGHGGRDDVGDEGTSSPRKVQKGQINALAKMLSALRR